jgi:hypothetical protein
VADLKFPVGALGKPYADLAEEFADVPYESAATPKIRAVLNEIDELRRTLAYDCARTDIESNCLGLRHGTEAINDQLVVRRLWNTAMATGGGAPDEPDRIARAIRYLDLCGLIKRQHHAPHIIQILDQPPPITG